MARSRKSLMTADEIYRLPNDNLRYELVRGHLAAEPPVGYRHGRLAVAIASALENYAKESGYGISVTSEVGFQLSHDPDTVRGPDVAVLRKPRLAELDDDSRFFPGAPDLAVEVLSPSDRPNAVSDKIKDYLDAGTHVVWIVDPQRRDVVVYTPDGRRILSVDETLDAPDLLPGFLLVLRDLFAPPNSLP